MDKIRIFFLTHRFIQGGAEQQLYELIKGIDKKKFDVSVASLVSGGEKWEDFNSIPNVKTLCFDRKHRFDFSVLSKIPSFLRQNPVDILHAYVAPATIFGILAGLMSRTPLLIIGERGLPSFPTIGSRIYFKLDNFIARYADYIIANSEAGRERRIESGISPDRIIVIPNGLNPDRLQVKVKRTKSSLGLDDICPLLGNVSRLAPVKDHHSLFQAIDLTRLEFPHIKCILVGDGPLRHHLEQQVKIKHLSQNVLFLGHQSNAVDFIRSFDVAVSSSLYEGSSNFILEAMACEKPIIATDVGGNRELVIDGITGFLVDKKDPQALAAAITTLLKDEELRVTLGRAGRERIEREFMLEQMIKKTEVMYEQVLTHRLKED